MPSSNKRFFPLPRDQWGAAQTWLDQEQRVPRKPRMASSVVLLRDGPLGLETYLGYRPGDSPLGRVAFPGGSIEESDDDPASWAGPAPVKWAQTLGMEDIGLARRHVAAAIREVFEETGVLLAGSDAASTVEGAQTGEWLSAREAVAGQDKSFAALLNRRGLSLRTDLLKPLAHWESPDFAHRRFSTRYFAAALPVNQHPSLLPSKGVWAAWLPATRLIAERGTTALGDAIGVADTVGRTLDELIAPATAIIVEKIAQSRGCIAYLSHKRPVRLHQPELVVRAGVLGLEVEQPPVPEGQPQRER